MNKPDTCQDLKLWSLILHLEPTHPTQATKLWTQSKPRGQKCSSPASLHPKLFQTIWCHVIQTQAWPIGLPLWGARVILGTFISCFPQWELFSQQRAVSCIDRTTQLHPQSHSRGKDGVLQYSQSLERYSSHTYLRLLHSWADPQLVAGYMRFCQHVPETEETSSREFEDKLPVPCASCTTAPRGSVAIKGGVPVFVKHDCLRQSNPKYLPGTWISNLRTNKLFRAVIFYSRPHVSDESLRHFATEIAYCCSCSPRIPVGLKQVADLLRKKDKAPFQSPTMYLRLRCYRQMKLFRIFSQSTFHGSELAIHSKKGFGFTPSAVIFWYSKSCQ